MADNSLWVAIVTALGTLFGGLGGGTLTHWLTLRRDRELAERDREERRLEAESKAADERRQAYGELLKSAAVFRLDLEISAQAPVREMSVRLHSIRDSAALVGDQAADMAMLFSGRPGDAAMALSREAGDLAAHFTRHTRLDQAAGGVFDGVLDFTAFDAALTELHRSVPGEPDRDTPAGPPDAPAST